MGSIKIECCNKEHELHGIYGFENSLGINITLPNVGNKISQVKNHYVQPTKAQHSIDVVKKYDGSGLFCAAALLFLLY